MSEKKLTVSIDVPDNLLRDLLVTAVEGGSNYWADFRGTVRDKELNILGVTVVEHEASSDGEPKSMVVTPAHLLEGLQRCVADAGKRPEFTNGMPCVMRCLNEDYDANDADIILQFTVLGELVYG